MKTPQSTSAQGQVGNVPATPEAPRGNSYRVYLMSTADPLNPTIQLVYVRAPKFGIAWKGARSLAKLGKVHDEAPSVTQFFEDEATTKPVNVESGDNTHVATVLDSKIKKATLTAAKIKEILENPEASDAERVEALRQMVGGATQ